MADAYSKHLTLKGLNMNNTAYMRCQDNLKNNHEVVEHDIVAIGMDVREDMIW